MLEVEISRMISKNSLHAQKYTIWYSFSADEIIGLFGKKSDKKQLLSMEIGYEHITEKFLWLHLE